MTLAINKYKIISDSNLWQSKNAKYIDIITLYIELNKLRNEKLKLVKTIFNKVMGDNKSKLNKNENKGKIIK